MSCWSPARSSRSCRPPGCSSSWSTTYRSDHRPPRVRPVRSTATPATRARATAPSLFQLDPPRRLRRIAREDDERERRNPSPCHDAPALFVPCPELPCSVLNKWAGLTIGSPRAFGDRTLPARGSSPPTPHREAVHTSVAPPLGAESIQETCRELGVNVLRFRDSSTLRGQPAHGKASNRAEGHGRALRGQGRTALSQNRHETATICAHRTRMMAPRSFPAPARALLRPARPETGGPIPCPVDMTIGSRSRGAFVHRRRRGAISPRARPLLRGRRRADRRRRCRRRRGRRLPEQVEGHVVAVDVVRLGFGRYTACREQRAGQNQRDRRREAAQSSSHGISITARVPGPLGGLSMRTVPPKIRMCSATSARPRPAPPSVPLAPDFWPR